MIFEGVIESESVKHIKYWFKTARNYIISIRNIEKCREISFNCMVNPNMK